MISLSLFQTVTLIFLRQKFFHIEVKKKFIILFELITHLSVHPQGRTYNYNFNFNVFHYIFTLLSFIFYFIHFSMKMTFIFQKFLQFIYYKSLPE